MSKFQIKSPVKLTLFTIAIILTGVLFTQLYQAGQVEVTQTGPQVADAESVKAGTASALQASSNEAEVQQTGEANADTNSNAQAAAGESAVNVHETALDRARKTWTKLPNVGRSIDRRGNFQRVTFYQADNFKYPNIRFDETFSEDPQVNPDAKLLRKLAYVADHILVRFDDEQRGLINGIIAGFPELSIRHELATGNHVLIEFPQPDYKRDYFSYWSARIKATGLTPEKDCIMYNTATPTDPSYAEQWSLNNTGETGGTEDADIDADLAWDIETGSKDVIVAVLDTGVDLYHNDLQANLWTSSAGSSIIRGANIVEGGSNPNDVDGHGTHVAGIIGAKSNNYKGIAGINWDVSIMAVKVLNDFGIGSTSDIVEGVDFATANGASIINMSLGGGEGSNSDEDSLYVELREARDMGDGILVVVAAGNDGINVDEYERTSQEIDNGEDPRFLALYDLSNIIAVASTDNNDELSGFSSYGAVSVDLAAPGSQILSTVPDDLVEAKDGTSMAAPHVAGVAALIKAQDPSLGYREIKNLLMNTVDRLPSLKDVTVTGGRLNANNALLSFNGSNAMITALNLKPIGNAGDNPDEILTLGESMLVDVGVANFGVADATNVSVDVELIQADAYAVILSGANFPVSNIPSGEEFVLENAFEIKADQLGLYELSENVELKFTLNFDGRTFVKYAKFVMFQGARVSGKVYDAVDGITPIDGARVEVIAETDAVDDGLFEDFTYTDANGAYELDLFTGIVAVRISKDGYVTSNPDILDLNPGNANLVKDYELGVHGYSLLTSTIDVTVPVGEQRSLSAKIKNTGTTPNALLVAMDYSITGSVIVNDQIYGLDGVGTSSPQILLLDEFSLSVEETIDLTLPEGRYAVDFCFFDGEMWILTRNEFGQAGVFAYDSTNWQLVFSRQLDMSSSRIKSVESLMVASIPIPTDEDPSATEDVLGLLVQHDYYRYPRLYRINPEAEEIADLTVEVGPLGDEEDDSGYYWWSYYRISGTNAKSRGTFFVGSDYELAELTIESFNSIIQESFEYLWNFNYFDFFNFEDYYYYYSFRDVKSLTYYEANQSMYVLTEAPRSNLLKINYDDTEITEIYTAPKGMDRLTSSSSSNVAWLSVGYRTGTIAKGHTASLPITLDTTDMRDGEKRSATVRVRSPILGTREIFTINLTVGDLSQLPGFVEWYQKFYLSDPDSAAGDSDTDGDGTVAEVEYVVGGNPIKNDNANGGLPTAVKDPATNDVFVKFRQRIDLPDDALVIKGTDTLGTPMVELVEGVNYEVISVTPINDEIEEILISSPFSGSFFYELEINL